MKILLFPLAVISLALLASCASTPDSRIARAPEVFQSLSPEDQALVREGRLRPGMTEDAVLLAMGRPSTILESVDKNTPTGRVWLYTGTRPVFVDPGPFVPMHGPYRYRRWDDPTPVVAYTRFISARLDFIDGKLVRWQAPLRR